MNAYRKKEKSEREHIISALQEFPHMFHKVQMREVEDLVQRSALESLKNHLEAALESGYHTNLEIARTTNLLAFALFKLGDSSEALDRTEGVLESEGQEHNLVSLANKAFMLCETKELEEAREVLQQLQELKKSHPDFDYLLVKAEGELAASFMRFGPRFNRHAARAFQAIIERARAPEVWMWKLALAVTHRHALDLQYAPYASEGNRVTPRDAMRLLQEVIDCQPCGEEDKARNDNLKANAHAEMALLLWSTLDVPTRVQLGCEANTGPMASCKKALALDGNDPSVLWKTGKIYRNYKDLFASRKLLEKAVEKQKSSAAYHHLGLTYKAMATNFKYGKLKTRRGGRRAKERKQAREERLRRERGEEGGGNNQHHGKERGTAKDGRGKKEKEEGDRIRKMVKSPKDTTEFDPEDHNVQLAFKNLQLAVDFSKGENSRAVYDLALMYKGTNNYDQALKLLREIQKRENQDRYTPSGVLERITAREQMGLIYREMAEKEADQKKKMKLKADSEKMFHRALSTAAELYSTTDAVRHIFGKIFHSPSALLKAADAADHSNGEKLKAQAEIFHLLNKHKKTQALLSEIAKEEHDARFYKLRIESDMKAGDPEKAAACLAMLKPTEMYGKVKALFEVQGQPYALHDVYLAAGRKALLEPADETGRTPYFTFAFKEVVTEPPLFAWDEASHDDQTSVKQIDDTPSGACSSPLEAGQGNGKSQTDTPRNGPFFHIMLLHDDEDFGIEEKAERLQDLLSYPLGLKVVRNHENYPPGAMELNAVLDNMDRSQSLVVLPGKEKMTNLFQEFVSRAAERNSTVVLLTDGVSKEKIPSQLETKHCMPCPARLFGPDVSPEGPHDETTVKHLCELFRFLGNTDQ